MREHDITERTQISLTSLITLKKSRTNRGIYPNLRYQGNQGPGRMQSTDLVYGLHAFLSVAFHRFASHAIGIGAYLSTSTIRPHNGGCGREALYP